MQEMKDLNSDEMESVAGGVAPLVGYLLTKAYTIHKVYKLCERLDEALD